ncbi:hypothetical protein [Blastopirellula retiformator]|nr:hypothetical protein [Blastopirellula retiformator]
MLVGLLTLIVVAAAIPIATWLAFPLLPSLRPQAEVFSGGTSYPASPLKFDFETLRSPGVGLPRITNVQVVNFDQGGQNDLADRTRS